MDVKLGYVFWHEDGEFSSILKQAKKWELDFVEICLDYPWPDTFSKDEMLAAKKMLADTGMDVGFHAPLGGILMFHPRKEIVNAAIKIHKKCLRFAARLNPLYYNFHVKTYPLELRIKGNKNIALQNCLNGLDDMIKVARKLDVRLVIENSTSTGYLVPFEELLPRKIDFNLDIGHWFAGKRGYERLEKLVNLLEERIVLLHLHDCKFQDEPIKDHLPLGQGDINFNRVFNTLKKGGIQMMALEIGSKETRLLKQNLSIARNLINQTRTRWQPENVNKHRPALQKVAKIEKSGRGEVPSARVEKSPLHPANPFFL